VKTSDEGVWVSGGNIRVYDDSDCAKHGGRSSEGWLRWRTWAENKEARYISLDSGRISLYSAIGCNRS